MALIGIDYTPAYEQGGGIGRYVRELVSAISAIDSPNDYSLFVSGAHDSKLPFTPGRNMRWKSTRVSPEWLARIWHRARVPLPVQFFVGSVDLFHATDFVLPPLFPVVPSVLTVHDLSFVRVGDSASPSLKRYLDSVVPRSVKAATHILADSQATAVDIQDLYNVPSAKISVLLSGVDAKFQQLFNEELILTTRKKYAIDEFPYIFTVGTVQPRKNYIRLIEALATLHQKGIDIHLVIAGGKGWLDNPIYDAIATYRMHEFVHFIGFADDNDLPTLYNAATCLAFPSLYEGFGLPILEAMACGTPVLTSNTSSLPEVAGDAAVLVDPYDVEAIADGLQRLLEDNTLRSTLTSKGLERVKEFTWQKSAHQLLNLYHNLLA